MSEVLGDSQGRQFRYLRLSVTEVCNFRCAYCLPQGYKSNQKKPEVSQDEIARLLRAFALLSFKKVRLTGGEPTLRSDLPEIIQDAAQSGYEVALTTNGYQLGQKIRRYKECGLSLLNLSLDSLRPERFKAITGKDDFIKLHAGLEQALSLGLRKIKINTVLMKGLNDDEFPAFLGFVKDRPISLRFIELMPTLQNRDFFLSHHLRSETLIQHLRNQGWVASPGEKEAGPALEFTHPDYRGQIGFISPYEKDFCGQCNRLRVSAQGNLRLCLFGNGETSLRDYLQDDAAVPDLVQFIKKTLRFKPASHGLHVEDCGDMESLSRYGG